LRLLCGKVHLYRRSKVTIVVYFSQACDWAGSPVADSPERRFSPMKSQTDLALEVLRDGGIVAFPTDTVYGLGADPANVRAVERIYRVKKRPPGLPLPLLLADASDISRFAESVPEVAWRLAERFLPGGLTLVLRRGASVPPWVVAGGGTVALRVPDHPVPIALARALGGAIVGTSANISGEPAPVVAEDVRRQLGAGVDVVIDGGRCPGGTESTVVDVSGGSPVILREGAVSREDILRAIG
jgi:L-threonylcarbamoyladenylate synthase